MDIVSRDQFLNKAVCISHRANALEKGMHPSILLQQWVTRRADWIFYLVCSQSKRRKTLNLNLLNSTKKTDLAKIQKANTT